MRSRSGAYILLIPFLSLPPIPADLPPSPSLSHFKAPACPLMHTLSSSAHFLTHLLLSRILTSLPRVLPPAH
ncbi:hypothetical protein B0H14DRAFT_3041078, partial [Mycena olivaceomarginata]